MPVCPPSPRATTRFPRFAPVPSVLITAAMLLASVLCSGSALAQTVPDAGPPFVNPYDEGASAGPSYAADGHDPAANDRKAGVSELNGDRILLNDPGTFPYPSDVDSGDIDGDGDADLVLALLGSGQLVWLENRCGPSGSSSQNCFGPPTVVFPRRNAIPHLIDVDGDADLDIVSVLPYDDEIVWFENTNASFSENRVIADLPGEPILMAPGDFDGDGLADVAVVRGQDSAVDFYTDLTTTPQLVQTVTTGGRVFTPSMLEVANLDADAADELVVGTTAPSPSPMNVYNADGSFTISRSTASMSTDYVQLIAVGDVDGDGDPDVVGASQNPDAGTYPLPWFPTEGGTLTGAAQTYRNVDDYPDLLAFLPAPAGSAQPLAVASRVNNQDTEVRLFESSPTGGSLASVTPLDGIRTNDLRAVAVDATAGADLVTVDRDGHQVYWHRNEQSTTGGFTLVEALGPAPDLVEPESPVALDVDEDGDRDIVALGYTDNQIAWYEQTNDAPLAFAPAQYIVDGTTTGPIAAVAADVTGDARPDLIVATISKRNGVSL